MLSRLFTQFTEENFVACNSPANSITIVTYTIVPLVSWAYVNVARALRMPIHVALVVIVVSYAIVEMDFMVKLAANQVSEFFF